MNKYVTGYKSTYIQDHPSFRRLCCIHVCVAVEWVKSVCPDVNMGNGTLARDLTINKNFDTDVIPNGWLNKLFVVVDYSWDKSVALVNWDGRFSVYVRNNEEDVNVS